MNIRVETHSNWKDGRTSSHVGKWHFFVTENENDQFPISMVELIDPYYKDTPIEVLINGNDRRFASMREALDFIELYYKGETWEQTHCTECGRPYD